MTTSQLPSFAHLDRMTDSTGLIQHAIYCVPRRESGYTTDDNARALRLCARVWNVAPDERTLARATIYLSFLEHAKCQVRGFHNFLGYQRDWLDAGGTGDCQGQAVLALAEVVASSMPTGCRDLARELLDDVMPALAELRSLRAQAYVVQAYVQLWRSGAKDLSEMETIAQAAADHLVLRFRRSRRPDWPWFESRMTYANAVLPHALFDAGARWPDGDYTSIAWTSFSFLDRVTNVDGIFWAIGNREWYVHGEARSQYDQQPVEASTQFSCAQAAALACPPPADFAEGPAAPWAVPADVARRARDWFYGRNSLNTPMASVETGACFDGLHVDGVNKNEGAESTLAYLWTEWTAPRAAVDSAVELVSLPSGERIARPALSPKVTHAVGN